MKVQVDKTLTVNSKVYFAGEAEVAGKEAEAVKAALAARKKTQTAPQTEKPGKTTKKPESGEGEKE
jgi:hypothetical protein